EPRLRPARRRAQAQREGGLVAGDRHRSRRRRRPRRGGHHASAGVGGLRPPVRFHGPARRLQELQAALPRRPGRGHALSRVRRRAHRGAAIQPHVQDLRRADGGHRARGLPPPGDGAEHVRQLPQRPRDLALEAALGIGQIGRSFRNEITPGNFLFRTREFEQMELEFFVRPGEDEQWYDYWRHARFEWYVRLGIARDRLRLRPHARDELAHYAKGCVDVEYAFPFGWSELEGIANRTDFDLKRHSEYSGKDLTYFDE